MSENEQSPAQSERGREMELIEQMFMSAHRENVRWRRWTIFARLFTLGLILALLLVQCAVYTGSGGGISAAAEEHTALVEVNGVVAEDSEVNADRIATGLRDAFEADKSQAVLLRINSPGGSPVQAGQIYREIERLREEYPDKKVHAAITDMGASGGYYIAAAADEIYVDPASIVGSIGVIMPSFGLTDAIDKLGVERRVLTAGENKNMLDPFKPLKPDHEKHAQNMLDQIHQQFIEAVKSGRGDRLADPDKHELFSGLFWTGERAVELGLADGLASPGEVARDVVGVEEIVNYTPRRNPLDKLMERFGASVGTGIGKALGLEETRLR